MLSFSVSTSVPKKHGGKGKKCRIKGAEKKKSEGITGVTALQQMPPGFIKMFCIIQSIFASLF
jgi:hypothetical protein